MLAFTGLRVVKMEDVTGYDEYAPVPDDATGSRFPYKYAVYAVCADGTDWWLKDHNTRSEADDLLAALLAIPKGGP